jgi:hypothetical protein
MTSHQVKHGILEDGYNRQWQAIVNPGKWITTDESRVAGWYHSAMTVGLEPKPIRTGATLHTVCITPRPISIWLVPADSVAISKIYHWDGQTLYCFEACRVLITRAIV